MIHFYLFVVTFLFSTLHPAFSQYKQTERTYGRKDSLVGKLSVVRACYDVTYYDLSFEVNKTRIAGQNEIYFRVNSGTQTIQVDLFKQYTISKILYKGMHLPFRREFNAVFVDFPTVLLQDSLYSIRVFYEGKASKAKLPPWKGGIVLKKDLNNKPWIGMACEQLGASSWWPCKDHWSDEADSMRISITVPTGLKAISNGNPNTETEDKVLKKKTYVWDIRNPINNYNVSFYIGDFTHFSDTLASLEGPLPLDFYVLPYHLERTKNLFKQCNEVLTFYEEIFGKYPFREDGFGMVESPFTGMEHQGAIAYGSEFDKNIKFYRKGIYDYIILHEIAHEWWGNSLTVDDISDLWIHEGLGTYAEMLFMERKFGQEEYLFELGWRSELIQNKFPMIGIRDVNYDFTFNSDIYFKGALVMHNLRCTINDDSLFFKVIKSFQVENQKSIVSNEKFINHVNAMTKKDYTPFFTAWLKRSLPPELEYTYEIKNKSVLFHYHWNNVPNGFEMPFTLVQDNQKIIRLVGADVPQKILLNDVKSTLTIQTMDKEINKLVPFHGYTYFRLKGSGKFHF